MNDSSDILAEIKRLVTAKYSSAKIYFYGSRGRGDMHKESDWDLLTLINEEKSSLYVQLWETTPCFKQNDPRSASTGRF
jgi:predicted nucleotidyltransferase